MTEATKKTKLFIVYPNHEEDLASDLKMLFDSWGLDAFYCHQEIKHAAAAEPYRKILRDNLAQSQLVILLLSREFQWSKYCQSEAGAIMATDKPRIIITIPPVEPRDVTKISPVLEGYNVLVPMPELKVRQLKSAIDRAIGTELVNAVETILDQELENRINSTLQRIVDAYRITPSIRILANVWPSITGRDPRAQDSIVEHIKRSLRNENPVTELALVGVSLKYSLNLVTRALKELSQEEHAACSEIRRKQLRIKLVHMNHHSHILRVINDNFDVLNIRRNFDDNWINIKEKWNKYAKAAFITQLEIVEPYGIDYIPPQLGICIDNSTFFSGRCAFQSVGVENHLLVGELEYVYYTDTDERGRKAIEEFKHALKVYENRNHNAGIALARDSEDWIKHLMDGISDSLSESRIILISQTGTKFSGLIDRIINQGLHVDIHLQDPKSDIPQGVKGQIEEVPSRLERVVAKQTGERKGSFKIFYYAEKPSYRAALIGDELLGYQTYVPSGDRLDPGPLRLIVTKASSQFDSLKKAVMLHRETTPASPPLN